MDSFTERNHIHIEPVKISKKWEAPIELREWILSLIMRLNYSIKSFRNIVCQMSFQTADPNQYSENEFMVSEVRTLLENCKWHHIYDIIEQTYKELPNNSKENFQTHINNFFLSNGYGWKLENGRVLSRGDDAFEQSVKSAVTCIELSNSDAYYEIKEALVDISKRPEPDVTGAIQHSMAALECFCRCLLDDEKHTLGELITHHRDSIPKPLDVAMEKLWAFSSEQGRHIKEGKAPSFHEAELTVHICASLIVYFNQLQNSIS